MERKKMQSWLDLISRISTRPRMYVHKGTFSEVCAWLNGFFTGLREGDPYAVGEWDAFTAWLQIKFRYPRNQDWSNIFFDKFAEDITALEQLRLLYCQFVDEKDNGIFKSGK